MLGSLVSAVVLLVLWYRMSFRFGLTSVFRVVYPLIITGFLLLPFLGATYLNLFAALTYMVFSLVQMLMMMQCAQISRDRGINPVFIYGFFGGIVYALHDVGFIGGTFAEQTMIIGIAPLAVVALVAVYLLGLMYFIGQGGFRRIFKHDSDAAASIELVALRAHAPEKKPAGANAEGEKPDDAVPKKAGKRGDRPPRASRKPQRERKREERVYLDRISKQAALLQQHYRLSERETEVMELIARGNTVARIAEDLVVTENTIRTHSKRIYAKLDIHKKQELLDLIESFDPNDLQE